MILCTVKATFNIDKTYFINKILPINRYNRNCVVVLVIKTYTLLSMF